MKRFVVAALLAACGGHNETVQQPTTPPPAATPPPTQPKPVATAGAIGSDDDYVAKATDLANRMIAAFKADGTNCDKLADDLDNIAPDVGPLTAYEKDHPAAKARVSEMLDKRANEMMEALAPAMNACQDNDKLKAVVAKFK